ncbi:NANOG neighbor homeobox [Plecturocebus cupreus]
MLNELKDSTHTDKFTKSGKLYELYMQRRISTETETLKNRKEILRPSTMAHTCNFSTREAEVQWLTPVIPALWEAKAGGSRGQEIKTILANMTQGLTLPPRLMCSAIATDRSFEILGSCKTILLPQPLKELGLWSEHHVALSARFQLFHRLPFVCLQCLLLDHPSLFCSPSSP